jgi:WD40 repeat protein/class 3 adenylate cyclase/tRNA A-37 threonylcarbamoyl transferase component Bud32
MPELLRDRYELLEVVGQGGEGRVVKALDHQHDRVVALKIRPVGSEAEREALLVEARILLVVPPHPHLPLVREDFFDGDQYVIAMDWVEGTDLGRVLRGRGRPGLAPSLVVQWLADAAAALTHLHSQAPPVIHGDVKPANLILTRGGRVTLVDFGLSSAPNAPHRRAGTRGYAAPELVASATPSRASDIYSLAATAFALLTGGPPTGIRPSWDGIDPAEAVQLEEAIRLGLATDPARRPDTPGELVERLRAGWAASLPTGVLTFCLTDIEGSTALWDAHPAEMATALVVHDEVVASTVEAHGGRFLKSMGEGDSTVSVFATPAAAVDSALSVVRRLAATPWPGELELRARVAIHTGEAERRGSDYYGTTLNVAARVRGLADGGQVFLSRATADLVRNHLPPGVSLVDLGPHQLRGLREREQVFALRADGISAPAPATECPYQGLLPFEAADADRFFGREDVIADIAGRLERHPFIAVVGGSGSGKSSVLRAGVALNGSGAEVITPGATPRAALASVAGRSDLLVVDQFEELFTLNADEAERDAFVAELLDSDRPVAIALRADFYGACAAYPDLATAVAAHQVLLGPMTEDGLRRAITEPARLAGLRLEPGLVDVLVNEVGGEPGALPLLSHALRATWEVRDGRTLTLDAYRSTGGVRGAIGETADKAVDSLDEADQVLARQLFLRLVDVGDGTGDTRRRARLEELTPARGGEGRLTGVVDTLAAYRLVTVDAGAVEVAHEALIREWPRLRDWLDEDREGLRIQRHVTTAAASWDALGRDPAELYRGPRLAAALDWLSRDAQVSELEKAFLDASQAEQDRAARDQLRANRRLRGLLVGAVVGLVAALVGTSIAVIQGRRAGRARDHADVARIAAVSRSVVERQPDVGLLLAANAYRSENSAETRSTLLAALETHPLLAGLLYGVESGLESATFTPDGKFLVTPTSDGSGTLVWDTATRKRVAALQHEKDFALNAAVSPDGHWLAVPALYETESGGGSRLEVWDMRTLKLDRVVDSPSGGLTTAAFSADGRILITQGGVYFDPDADLTTTAVVWDTTSWKPIGTPWTLHDDYFADRVVTVSPDGSLLGLPKPDGTVAVWRVADRRLLHTTPATDEHGATALAFSPDNRTLVIAGQSGRVAMVDPTTGLARRSPLFIDRDQPSSAEFSPDGRRLAVAAGDGRTHLFDVESGEELGTALAANASVVNDVSFSRDGTLLATAGLDRTGAIWRLDGARTIGTVKPDHTGAVTQVTYTPDGNNLIAAGLDGTVTIRNLATGNVRRLEVGGAVLTVAVDKSGRRLAAGGTEGVVKTFDIASGAPGNEFHVDGFVAQLAFNPRTGSLAVAALPPEPNQSGQVIVWDPTTGREVGARIAEELRSPVALAWRPDGRQLAVSMDSQVVHFYDDATHREVGGVIESVDARVMSIAFSPDGTRLATGTSSGIVRQWSARTRRELGAPLKGHVGNVAGVAYSPDGKALASTTLGFSRTRLWDAATGAPIGDELTAGRVPFTFRTFTIENILYSRPAFSPDGRHLATPSFDGTVVVWDLDTSHWLASTCALVGRDLTRAEWRQYFGSRTYRPTCPN